MNKPLHIRQLTKRFASKNALDSVTLDCTAGSIVGLLGPNGSGKTTLLKSIAGLCLPTSGEVETFGKKTEALEAAELSRLGFVQQESELFDWLNVSQQIEYISSFYENWDAQRASKLTEVFSLDQSARVANLSTGDRQKLAIILAVCHHPKLLLLDEPASALDPEARASLLHFLIELARDEETAVIISSHILVDVEKIIDHVWFLKSGQVIADDDLDTLKESYAEWNVSSKLGQSLPDYFSESFILSQSGDNRQKRLYVSAAAANPMDFQEKYNLTLSSKPLNLESLYPLLSKTTRKETPSHAFA